MLVFCVQWSTKKQILLLAMNPRNVGPLCLVFATKKTFSWKESPRICLLKAFCKNGGEEENRIAQAFAQWTFLDKASVEQKLLERCWEIGCLKFLPWSHIYIHLMALEEAMLKVVTFGFKTSHFKKLWSL